MSNGSLFGLLFGISRPRWKQRMQIALGIARGLTYLHEECSTQIIHCDVKPPNILLDESLTPKISDFGLAKLLLSEQSRAARTHIRGTAGYFAPEWFRKASITMKVDVYSFGVMLLEMICCMSCVEFGMGDQEEALIDWVYDRYSEMKLNMLVENDEEAKNDIGSVERSVMFAIWCIQEDPSLRPSMRRVTQCLRELLRLPFPFALFLLPPHPPTSGGAPPHPLLTHIAFEQHPRRKGRKPTYIAWLISSSIDLFRVLILEREEHGVIADQGHPNFV
ncbi:Non-specific serine/threonine protein kinase [Handroanthus impetiginosus]|uniref:Non-specific serine/threonine protein kinase n=1 Tax=Handroanthus impetiginosus TaxID=429701 RepID=A0A2G9I608_9LAMI|nr:Non-specific serine/threonine protein kinase [Handroanthus impetiginosus]